MIPAGFAGKSRPPAPRARRVPSRLICPSTRRPRGRQTPARALADSLGCGSSGGTGTARTEAGKSPITTGLLGRRRPLWSAEERVKPTAVQARSRQVWTRPRLQTGQNAGQPRLLPPDRLQLRGFCVTPEEPHPNHQAATLDSHAECVECGHEQNRVIGRERVARTAARPLGGSPSCQARGQNRPPVSALARGGLIR